MSTIFNIVIIMTSVAGQAQPVFFFLSICRPVLLRTVQPIVKFREYVRSTRREQKAQESVEPEVPV